METIGARDPSARQPCRSAAVPRPAPGGGHPFPSRVPGPCAPRAASPSAQRAFTFHPVHDLTRRPFAHGFHDQRHGLGSVGAGRGAGRPRQLSSPSRPRVGSPAGLCLAGRAARRRRLLFVGSLVCSVSEPSADSGGGSGDGEGNASVQLGARSGGGRCGCGSAAPRRVEGPRRLQFMARAAEGSRREAKEPPPPPARFAANLPARLARGTEALGTTSCLAEMTRGLLPPKISRRSPRVRGARTASPPPARCRAVPPPGRRPAREARARACKEPPPFSGSLWHLGRCGCRRRERRPRGPSGTAAREEAVTLGAVRPSADPGGRLPRGAWC